ncbi:TonB-dependent receptor domain-containing protein [Sinimarinibacterium thermocellulolyticum]|uniref:TonB-dependent receptor n=1 Tax=Sinimarinibacterium thermocellulolyticum TaxID=3170016 RepID=A0ABV2ADN8_9GAMM
MFYQLLRPAPVIGATFPADPALDREVSLNTYTEAVNRSTIFSGTVDWFTDVADIKLIGSWQRAEVPELHADFDNTARPGAEAHAGGGPARQVYNQTTAELQLLSNQSSPGAEHFSWVAGLFFLQSDGGLIPVTFKVAANALGALVPGVGDSLRDTLDALLVGLGLPAIGADGVELANSGGLDNTSYSAYAQGTWYMTETLDLTAGTRYQYEERDLVDTYTAYVAGDGRLIPLPVPFADTRAATQNPPLLAGSNSSTCRQSELSL